MVKNKSNVVKRGLYSCRQRYAALQWSKCCATNWATSPSARFALVIEYVSSIMDSTSRFRIHGSIHPWANSRCWISQSERALCFSYVIICFSTFKDWFLLNFGPVLFSWICWSIHTRHVRKIDFIVLCFAFSPETAAFCVPLKIKRNQVFDKDKFTFHRGASCVFPPGGLPYKIERTGCLSETLQKNP